jgi:hypothetical protein
MAAAAVPIPFALVPGDVNPNDVIDYHDESNREYYLNMTKELKNNFNLTELNLKFNPLFNIPEDVNVNNGPTIHLLTHYGQVTLEQVAMCVLKSLTKEAKDNIELESDKYTIGGTKVGILIIKVAQIKARADTQFTADAIRSKLRNLSQANGHNIDKFNQHVRALISSLAARGLTPGDSLYTDLMAGYVTCTDQAFVKYIQHLAWTIHEPEECNKIPSGGSSTQEEDSRGDSGNSFPRLRLAEALSAVMQE